jgi:hypothetical protein
MIVQVSVAKPAKRAGTFVIDWDRVARPSLAEIARDIALSLDELARRGAGWKAVETREPDDRTAA